MSDLSALLLELMLLVSLCIMQRILAESSQLWEELTGGRDSKKQPIIGRPINKFSAPLLDTGNLITSASLSGRAATLFLLSYRSEVDSSFVGMAIRYLSRKRGAGDIYLVYQGVAEEYKRTLQGSVDGSVRVLIDPDGFVAAAVHLEGQLAAVSLDRRGRVTKVGFPVIGENSPNEVGPFGVESRLSASTDAEAPPRFPAPLIKPDVPISSIRLSDRLIANHLTSSSSKAHQK